MKAMRMIRYVDNLGRVVIPIELRKTHDLDSGSQVEMYVEGEQVVFRRYTPRCIFCGNPAQAVKFKGKAVCSFCQKDINTLG